MKTHDNGVMVFDEGEFFPSIVTTDSKPMTDGTIYVVMDDGLWVVKAYNDRVIASCHDRQDALDIAAMFAERAKPCEWHCSVHENGRGYETQCGGYFWAGDALGQAAFACCPKCGRRVTKDISDDPEDDA